ncbi:septum site-determining protein MinD [Alicyclobacillus tolerans]|uniref:Septum site-determining protein MinD n=1 Tax=Alicyclobacillus tolerans TaxID=90970 RepID=A0A1M6XHN6_9BACL|nr:MULTISPECIES: septum site-determining protein MinD [Alicyclobacillus]QRF23215.1 septum site-determining protein MinD [Alicyclobacillus sp. TC]SHL05530.1 septum site-determining protein MinD [Alicyclobacillus montanus]
MGTSIVVTSGKGGVGKTTTTANIGSALALLGKSVVLIDADIGLRNLDVVLGLENRIVYDIVDVATGDCRLDQALIRDKRFDHLSLLPAAQTKDKSALTVDMMKSLVMKLKEDFDFVIIDCPAGIELGFRVAVSGADRAIVVTTPETPAVRDADRVIGLLENEGVLTPKLVVNRIRPQMVKRGEMLDIDEIVQVLAIDLLGIVPDDEAIISNANKGEPTVIKPDSKASMAYRNIARRMLGDSVPLMVLEEQRGLWGKFKKVFGSKS